MKRIRIGNIEFNGKDELLRWYPCEYFNKKDDYLKNGYIEENGFLSRENHHIDSNFFKTKELCCVIAMVKFDSDGFYFETIGTRLTDMELDEFKDLKHIVELMKEDLTENGDNNEH